jgi:hypothetical protein
MGRIIEGVAGRTPGTAQFYDEGGASEHSSVMRAATADATARTVRVVTVDDALGARCWDGVDLLKIDAEGYDSYEIWALRSSGPEPLDHGRYGEFFSYANFIATTPQGEDWLQLRRR